MDYDEFRLVVMPDMQTPGSWSIQVQRCPIAAEVGPKGSTKAILTRAQLNRLRNPNDWPDETVLRKIGEDVWNSVMTPRAGAAFGASSNLSRAQGRGLRLVISLVGNVASVPGNGDVSLGELPIEALFQKDFIGCDDKTPISRSLQVEADRPPLKTAFPLRVLVIAAQPSDRPPVNAELEVAAIRGALQPLIDQKAIELDRCEPPTIAKLMEKLKEGYHILHFIGHGSFETVGNDPFPKPHICFEDGSAVRDSELFDGDQLSLLLRDTSVQLVVLTSCSSAAAAPVLDPYPVLAFEGIAQRLIDGTSGPSAVVAMQFDLETKAAETFSGALYEALVKNDWALDEAVARARVTMRIRLKPGHRCFVNPVVYWRCINGKVFDLVGAVGDNLPLEDQKGITLIDAQIEATLQTLRDIATQPQQIRKAAEPFRVTLESKVEDLIRQRGDILGETLRLVGGKFAADGSVECRLTLRLRAPATIGNISVRFEFDPTKLQLSQSIAGANTPGNDPFLQNGPPGTYTILVQNVSNGASLEAKEYELAKLVFRLNGAAADPLLQIRIAQAFVDKDGKRNATFRTMDAIVMPA
jgi:hypothetical protein